jgi:hypothetical protein
MTEKTTPAPAATGSYDPNVHGKPTPTQAEMDAIASGNPPETLEPDGSPEQPHGGAPIPPTAEEKKKRELEEKEKAAGADTERASYKNREIKPETKARPAAHKADDD